MQAKLICLAALVAVAAADVGSCGGLMTANSGTLEFKRDGGITVGTWCTWEFKIPNAIGVTVEIVSLDLNSWGKKGCKQQLMISEGDNFNNEIIKQSNKKFQVCGNKNTLLDDIVIDGSNFFVDLVGAYSGSGTGFTIKWTAEFHDYNCTWTSWMNEYNGHLNYQTQGDKAIVGIESFHDNTHEDRQYRFKSCELHALSNTNFLYPVSMTECGSSADWENDFDGSLDYMAPNNSVIVGVESEHDDGTEDRRFKYDYCKLQTTTDAAFEVTDYDEVCTAPVDLLFLVDKSASIDDSEWELEKSFLGNLTQKFDVSPENAQVGMIIFANHPHRKWCFGAHNTSELAEAIADLDCEECLRGRTGTGQALKMGVEEMFTEDCNVRTSRRVPKVVIVLTDGRSTEPREPHIWGENYLQNQVDLMHNTGAAVITVGVGVNLKMSQLKQIATDDTNVFTVETFYQLLEIMEDVAEKTCEVSWSLQPFVAPDPECHVPVDIVFLVDKSGSIQPDQWVVSKDFVAQMMTKFDIGEGKAKVALALFAKKPHLKWCFDDYTTVEALYEAAEALDCPECIKGRTGTGQAMKLAREEMLTETCGARDGVKKIVIILTDGRSTEWKDAEFGPDYMDGQNQLLKDTGAEIIVIGVGKLKERELVSLATDDSKVFTASNFGKLLPMMDNVAIETCREASEDVPVPECFTKLDLYFLLDKSASIKPDQWIVAKQFVKAMIGKFDVGPDAARVALDVFAIQNRTQWDFYEYTTQAQLIDAVEALECTECLRGKTGTGKALRYAAHHIETEKAKSIEGRENVKVIVVVITDGGSTEKKTDGPEFLGEQVALIKSTGAEVITVGVGSYNIRELQLIATSPSNVFTADDFSQLMAELDDVAEQTCEVGALPTTTPMPTVRPLQVTRPVTLTDCKWTTYQNTPENPLLFETPNGEPIVGMASEHDDTSQDRKWKFYYCKPVVYVAPEE